MSDKSRFSDDDLDDELEENEAESKRPPQRGGSRSGSEQRRSSDPRARRPGGFRRRGRRSRQVYCPKGKCFDYKNVEALKKYLTEAGKIRPRRTTGVCSRCQRELAREIKRARHLAMLPYAGPAD